MTYRSLDYIIGNHKLMHVDLMKALLYISDPLSSMMADE